MCVCDPVCRYMCMRLHVCVCVPRLGAANVPQVLLCLISWGKVSNPVKPEFWDKAGEPLSLPLVAGITGDLVQFHIYMGSI